MADDSDNIEINTKQQSKKANGDAKTYQSLPGTAGLVWSCLLGQFGFYGSGSFLVVTCLFFICVDLVF